MELPELVTLGAAILSGPASVVAYHLKEARSYRESVDRLCAIVEAALLADPMTPSEVKDLDL